MPQRKRPMDDRALAAIVDEQVNDSVAWYNSDAARMRVKALAYFEGQEDLNGDTPVRPGKSKVVSRDMSDVHGWIMPSLLRTFLNGDRVVVYEPRRQNAEEAAKQATDYVNYLFHSECSGYALLHSAMWDGLTFGNGIIKHWWDDTPCYETQSFSGLPEAAYIRLVSDPDVEVLEHTAHDDTDDTSDDALADAGRMDGQLAPPAGGPAALGGAAPGTNSSGAPGAPAAGGGVAPGIPAEVGALAALGGPAGGIVGGQGTGFPGPGLPAGEIPATGLAGLAAPQLHDLKIKRRIEKSGLRLVAVPPEHFRIDRNATVLDEDHVRFCAHVDPNRTRSSLIVDFPDKRAIIDDLPAASSTNIDDQEAIIRDRHYNNTDKAPDSSTDLIEVWECYVQLDFDGTGVAAWRRVITVAGASERQILLNEEWGDDLPFTDLVPDPMPHRWRGGSLYEELGDVQRTKTVLLRGVNDNIYWVNHPMRTAVRGAVTPAGMDRLQNPNFGALIEVETPDAVQELPTPFVADKLMMALEMWDQVREFRTGVSASTMSLDPEALQNQTATAVNAAQTASYTKVETYARNIAELGLKRLFRCILKLVVKHQDKTRTIRLRDEWVDMDPRSWDADMDVTINVGLGSGSRDRDMGVLQPILMKMELVLQTLGPQVATQLGMGVDRYFDALRKFVEAAGIKQPESFFPVIKPEQMQAIMQQMGQMGQQADPHAAAQAAEIQARIPLMQAEAQGRLQESQARTQLLQAQIAALGTKTQGDAAKGQIDAVKGQADAQRGMLGIEHDRAQIENLRAAAMANMAKAGAVQSDAEINQQLARLEALDHLVGWHHEQQRIANEHANDQAMQRMKQKVSTPGVNA